MSYTENIKWFDTIDSTNNQLLIDKANLPDKSVYAALFQTAGKGQRGNKWESRSGENLTFSVLFRPTDIASNQQFTISQAVALGIVDYLAEKSLIAKIKWPNDIYICDLKICGILIENTISNDKLTYSVAGAGINLNQTKFDLNAPNPTSVALLKGTADYSPVDELPQVLKHIFRHYDALQHGETQEIAQRYTDILYRRGEQHRYFDCIDNKEVTASITGIDEAARLLLTLSDGSTKSYAFKELKYIL